MFIRDLNLTPVPKEDLPSQYRELLDCSQPATLKLESFYQEEMHLKVLASTNSGNVYRREIVMLGGRKRVPRELAYIEIFLDSLPSEVARTEVKEGEIPFGKILASHGIETKRDIEFFFKVRKEGQILKYSENPNGFCYGRRYFIWLLSGEKKLANVTEIYFDGVGV